MMRRRNEGGRRVGACSEDGDDDDDGDKFDNIFCSLFDRICVIFLSSLMINQAGEVDGDNKLKSFETLTNRDGTFQSSN